MARLVPAFVLAGCFLAQAEQPPRIHQHRITDEETFTLKGNVHPLVPGAADLGRVEGSLPLSRLSLHFNLTVAQQADLTQLLKNLQDRSSPQYHKFLTPAQYGDRFGLCGSDMNKVVAWLQGKGFTDVQPSPMRTSVSMSGNASQVQNAFRISLRRYRVAGEERFANLNDPVLPKALEGMVASVRGLNDFRPRPRSLARPHFTSGISGGHFITPDDFAAIYDLKSLYSSGIDGAGVTIAVAGQTDIALSDIEAFRSAAGLPAKDPTVQLFGKDPGTVTSDVGEADLDIELAGGVARNASIVYVNSSNAFDSLQYAIDNDLASIVSISYGDCESNIGASDVQAFEQELQKGSALGITIVAASGDNGAADCDSGTGTNSATIASNGLAVDYPASSAYVTGVGGTEFTDGNTTGATPYWSGTNNSNNGSALSYIPEGAWNDTAAQGQLAASGGGVSIMVPKPNWQTGSGVPNDGFRDVPDVSFTASPLVDSVLICASGWCTNGFRNAQSYLDATGGTSVGAPSFAGVVALINQKAGGRQGNVNPVLYELANVSSGAFHDIDSGNNIEPCKTGSRDCPVSGSLGYAAGKGYDQVTGLGSVDGANLVNAWPDFQISLTPASISVAASKSSNVTINVTRTPYFAGNVSFACTTNVASLTCTAPGSVTNSGSATLTITRAANAALWIPPQFQWPWPLVELMLFAGTALLALRRRQLLWAGAGCLLVAAAGCGGGSSSPTVAETVAPAPQTATVTVTASSGFLSQTSTLTVTLS